MSTVATSSDTFTELVRNRVNSHAQGEDARQLVALIVAVKSTHQHFRLAAQLDEDLAALRELLKTASHRLRSDRAFHSLFHQLRSTL